MLTILDTESEEEVFTPSLSQDAGYLSFRQTMLALSGTRQGNEICRRALDLFCAWESDKTEVTEALARKYPHIFKKILNSPPTDTPSRTAPAPRCDGPSYAIF